MEKEGDRYVLVGGASRIAHGASYGKYDNVASTVMYDIRKEGFCALEGKSKDSIVYLKPIYFEGGDITVNANASAGKVSLAIIEANGKEIEGFGFDDCVSIENEDTVERKITFKNADTDALKGKRIRFALRIDNALLYSVSFEGRPFLHNRPQYGFNDPRPMDI